MMFYDGIDASESTDVGIKKSCRCMLLQMSMNCRYQLNVCECYHDLMMTAMKFDEIAIIL